jgi:hypothetical protein
MNGAYGEGLIAVQQVAQVGEVAAWLALWVAAHVLMIWIACRGRGA